MSLQNSLQEQAINEVKDGFINYLRKQLRNGKIDVVTKIDATKGSAVIYTDTDKYNYLNQQTPNLEVFKKDLNLDF